jgi:hypothetical protein
MLCPPVFGLIGVQTERAERMRFRTLLQAPVYLFSFFLVSRIKIHSRGRRHVLMDDLSFVSMDLNSHRRHDTMQGLASNFRFRVHSRRLSATPTHTRSSKGDTLPTKQSSMYDDGWYNSFVSRARPPPSPQAPTKRRGTIKVRPPPCGYVAKY